MNVLTSLIRRAWWAAAGQRALRSALVALLPFVPGLVVGEKAAVIAAASTMALAIVLSLATSLANLPELDGTPRPWWLALIDRAVRTFFQVLLAGIPAVTLIQNVPWTNLLTGALVSTAGTVVLALISMLPEATPPAPGLSSDAGVDVGDDAPRHRADTPAEG